jgi:Domain of unknown function (DUF4159)
MPRGPWRPLLAAVLLFGVGASLDAQRYFREGSFAPQYAPAIMPDAEFVACRLEYTRVRYEDMGLGWITDYPYAERNLMTRLSELTRTHVSLDPRKGPRSWVVHATDPQLFNCPYLVASDVGTIGLSQAEAVKLREYLLKGGFFWVDDFWGTAAWEQWSIEIAKVFPSDRYPIRDVPLSDPLLRSQFIVSKVPQITNIMFWRRSGGRETSERGPDSAEPHLRAIRDDHGRIMVLMTHNTDVADSWEREGEDPGFFFQFSPNGYALGIDVLLHAMSH